MAPKSEATHLVTMRVRNFPGHAGDVCLRILANAVIARPGSRRYHKIKAIDHDGREYHGWVSSSDQNPMIVARIAPLQFVLYVNSERVTFDYLSGHQISDLATPRKRTDFPPAKAGSVPAEQLWAHVSAVIKSIPMPDDAAVSRVRKAVALMFHSDATTNKIAHEVLARANALIDSRSRQQAA